MAGKRVAILAAGLRGTEGPRPLASEHVFSFDTYGPLRVVHAGCPQNAECHYGPAMVVFSTPVRGADVLRHVRLSRDGSETKALCTLVPVHGGIGRCSQ